MPDKQMVPDDAIRIKTTTQKARTDIVYISSHATCENDIAEALIHHLFAFPVWGFPWEEKELKEKLEDETNPMLIIMSAPLERND